MGNCCCSGKVGHIKLRVADVLGKKGLCFERQFLTEVLRFLAVDKSDLNLSPFLPAPLLHPRLGGYGRYLQPRHSLAQIAGNLGQYLRVIVMCRCGYYGLRPGCRIG